MDDTAAIIAVRALGLPHEVVRHGPVRSLQEAAEVRGVAPADIIKTMVVRRGDDDYVFVLVPGDRVISWPKLRRLLDTNRLSMPDADTALGVTGYVRGTITPFGSTQPWPVIADERAATGTVSIGGGAHGVSLTMDATVVITALDATVDDVTDPETPPT